MTGFWKQVGMPSVGTLVLKEGNTKPLSPREMSNKIIHAEKIEWDFSEQPKIVCTGRDKEQWLHAIIEVRKLLWIGKLQERYGIAKDQARKDVDDWFNAQRL